MKLLVLLDGIYAPNGPTLRFGARLARELAGMGCDVTLLENVPFPADDFTDGDGVRHVQFCEATEKDLYRRVQAWREQGLGLPAMLLRAAGRPRLLWTAIGLLVFKRSPVEKSYCRHLEALAAGEKYDAVVSVSAPHYTAMALAFSRYAGVKAAYMVDPYASAAVMKSIASPRREAALYKALDVAFVTKLMMEHGLFPQGYRGKAVALEFPNVEPPVAHHAPDDVALDDAFVNCVFVGNLYLDIRSPEFALELFARLPERYRLVLVGDGFSQFPSAFRGKYEKLLGERLLLHPPVSPKAAADAMQKADVLVNIGNTDPGQLPSKIYDYVSCGLPILNLCKLDDCPTAPVLRDYPLCCTVRETAAPTDEQMDAVGDFLRENAGKRLPFEAVAPLYREHTPAAVAGRMLAALEAAVREKRKGGRRA